MPVRPMTARRVKHKKFVESLENRTLLAIVNVTDFGAIPDNTTEDGPAIQRAINASAPGDIINFPKGTYRVGGSLTLLGDRTYQGVAGSVLQFNISARQYGLIVAGNAANVTVQNLHLDGGGISLTRGTQYRNIKILNNEISKIAQGTRGVYATIDNVGLIVEGNVFRDYNEWGVMIYHMDQGSFSRNRFHNITQAAQIVNPYDNVTVSFNGGCGIKRMGLEIQQFTSTGRPTNNLTVEGNVFIKWNKPYWDSFGLSIMPQNSYNTRIINNYVYASGHENGWSQPDSSGTFRWGYGIEAGFRTGVVENNVVAGPWANHIVVSMPNTLVKDNKMFGRPSWGAYVVGEPGMQGFGSAVQQGNTTDTNLANVPPPPFDPCAGLPPPGSPPPPTPVPNPTPQQGMPAPVLTARAASSTRADLSWNDSTNLELGYKVERSFNGPDGPFSHVALTAKNVTRYSNVGLPAGKTVWYRVRAYAGSRPAEYSNVVMVKLPGSGGTSGTMGLRSTSTLGSTTGSPSPFSDLLV